MKDQLSELLELDSSTIRSANDENRIFHHKLFYDGLKPIMLRYIESIPTGRVLSPIEVWSLAVASSIESMNSPVPKLPEEIWMWQLTFQQYLWEDFSLKMWEFYKNLLPRLRVDHTKLLWVLKNYPSQVYLLKIAFDVLHTNIINAGLPERVIFGLVCVELMKSWIRPYLISKEIPSSGDSYTDWMSIIDHCFSDFLEDMSQDSSYTDLLPLIAYIRVNRDIWSSIKSEAHARRFEQMYAGDALKVTMNVIKKAQDWASGALR